MTYAAQQDLYDRFGQAEIDPLADRNGDGVPDPGVIDGILADADETINSYLQARYTLPLVLLDGSSPVLLNRLACDLARYDLYSDAVPATVQARRDAAIKLLQAISVGTASLGISQAVEPASSDSPKIAGGPRKFNDDTLCDYVNQPNFPYA
ncbi:MAG: DUF1320 domain-containing protein [Bradyrhizobium sp.]|nr:DUF1320 domain-containing protein [Bradyrhizobium sp.]